MSDVAGETTLVGETGKGDFQVEVRAGTSTVPVDKLIQAGGLRSGPNPDDLLSAAMKVLRAESVRSFGRPPTHFAPGISPLATTARDRSDQ
jgi:hypothetical protein